MKQIDPTNSEFAFVDRAVPMFAELVARLANEDLSETRKRDIVSGLRHVAQALGRPPEEVPSDPRWLQPRLAKVSPAALGLSPKSWQNALSYSRAALVHFGLAARRINRVDRLGPEWYDLWAAVLASKDPTLPLALSRFVYFLDRRGILPEDVREQHAIAYRDAAALNEISKSPEVAYRAAVNGWNLAGERITGWPKTRIALPSRQKQISIPIEQFPESFGMDLDRLIASMTDPDPLSESSRRKALRPATLDQYRQQLHRFASELVHSGVAIDDIISIADLLDPVMAERGLRQMLKRNDNQTTRVIADTAALLRNLGRTENSDPEAHEELARLAARVAPKAQQGMTRKNRDRLRVLQNPDQQRKLLHLPERLFAAAGKAKTAFTSGLVREDALAIAILLTCPVRIRNVASIHLDQNLQRPGDGRAFLVFGEAETKTSLPIEFELPPDVLRMVDRHLASRSPALCPAGTPWLFPRRDGADPVQPGELSTRISRRIRRETGLEMNAHLFRHFAVMLWLDASPGTYEAARQLLGHSAVSHTINMYSGLEGYAAIRAYADLIATRKGTRK